MKPIPKALRDKIAKNPFMETCIHKFHHSCNGCEGEITWEHSHLYGGSRINEEWAIVPCCRKHNVGVTGTEKDFNKFVALERCNISEIEKIYPRYDWRQEYTRLRKKFTGISNFLFQNDSVFNA